MSKIMEADIGNKRHEIFGSITKGNERIPIVVDKVVVDGVDTKDFGTNWAGNINYDEEDFANSVFAAYFNEDSTISFSYVSKEIEKWCTEHQKHTHEVNGRRIPDHIITPSGDMLNVTAIARNTVNSDWVSIYYTNELGDTILTRLDGSVATDMENFFMDALIEDATNAEMLYITNDIREWLNSEYGIDLSRIKTDMLSLIAKETSKQIARVIFDKVAEYNHIAKAISCLSNDATTMGIDDPDDKEHFMTQKYVPIGKSTIRILHKYGDITITNGETTQSVSIDYTGNLEKKIEQYGEEIANIIISMM